MGMKTTKIKPKRHCKHPITIKIMRNENHNSIKPIIKDRTNQIWLIFTKIILAKFR